MAVVFTFPSQLRQGVIQSPSHLVSSSYDPRFGVARINLTIAPGDVTDTSKSLAFSIERLVSGEWIPVSGATWNGGPQASNTLFVLSIAKTLAFETIRATLSIPVALTVGGTVEVTPT